PQRISLRCRARTTDRRSEPRGGSRKTEGFALWIPGGWRVVRPADVGELNERSRYAIGNDGAVVVGHVVGLDFRAREQREERVEDIVAQPTAVGEAAGRIRVQLGMIHSKNVGQ